MGASGRLPTVLCCFVAALLWTGAALASPVPRHSRGGFWNSSRHSYPSSSGLSGWGWSNYGHTYPRPWNTTGGHSQYGWPAPVINNTTTFGRLNESNNGTSDEGEYATNATTDYDSDSGPWNETNSGSAVRDDKYNNTNYPEYWYRSSSKSSNTTTSSTSSYPDYYWNRAPSHGYPTSGRPKYSSPMYPGYPGWHHTTLPPPPPSWVGTTKPYNWPPSYTTPSYPRYHTRNTTYPGKAVNSQSTAPDSLKVDTSGYSSPQEVHFALSLVPLLRSQPSATKIDAEKEILGFLQRRDLQ